MLETRESPGTTALPNSAFRCIKLLKISPAANVVRATHETLSNPQNRFGSPPLIAQKKLRLERNEAIPKERSLPAIS